MLWMHYLVGISHFAKYGTNRPLTVWEMPTNVKKNISFRNGEENEKVSWNPHADPDHHQKLITSRGSYLTHACQVWSTFVSAFVSYPVYRMTQIEWSHNLRLVGKDNDRKQRPRNFAMQSWRSNTCDGCKIEVVDEILRIKSKDNDVQWQQTSPSKCCHLMNLMARFWRHCPSILKKFYDDLPFLPVNVMRCPSVRPSVRHVRQLRRNE